MPTLTDREEPEDFEPHDPDEPNDYALHYLFNSNRPGVELVRSGRILFYTGAATNVMAFLLYAAWLELNFVLWLLLAGLAVVATGGVAALNLRSRPALARLLGLGPLILTVLTLIILLVKSLNESDGFFFFFIPGSLAQAGGVFLLLLVPQPESSN